MLWQDVVFTLGELLFLANLLPLLRRPELGLPRVQSWTYAGILAAYGVASWTLGLPLATVVSALSAAAWGYLAWHAPDARRPSAPVTASETRGRKAALLNAGAYLATSPRLGRRR